MVQSSNLSFSGYKRGMKEFTKLLQSKEANHLDIVQFEQGDIERHNAVKEILEIYGDE